MSKSYHATKKEIDEMIKDKDSILHELATKSHVKKSVKRERKKKSRL